MKNQHLCNDDIVDVEEYVENIKQRTVGKLLKDYSGRCIRTMEANFLFQLVMFCVFYGEDSTYGYCLEQELQRNI